MQTDRELFNKYYQANTVRLEDASVCTSRCKKLHWCSITEIDYKRFHKCNSGTTIMPGTVFFLISLVSVSNMMQ
ncbi:hypothetical protein SK128_002641 [Halocaridina rubra]|uniref:Sphingomyelin phosphodiesterase C-terminal domain-containing protein n=1 Tax=Halocaridina rubra TaxID=373956 RepID=A0AAN8WLP7_HALRR